MENGPDLEYAQYIHDTNHVNIKQALSTVLEFCKRKKRIMVGGQAIHFAMKLKNKSLYNEEKKPDYDFYSPTHYEDALELANILCAKKMPLVDAINAQHITTFRVRVASEAVADITYVPQIIYDSIPTITYEGVVCVHPDVQKIDQHRSMCYMFENPPREVIFARFEKDVERYQLLEDLYPISCDEALPTKQYNVPLSLLESCCLAGYAAFAHYSGALHVKGAQVIMSLVAPEVALYTDDIESIVAAFKKHYKCKVKYYNAYLGRFPPSAKFSADAITFTVYDNRGSLLNARKDELYFIDPQGVLMYALHYKNYAVYCAMRSAIMKNKLYPGLETYGKTNEPESLLYYREIFDCNEARNQTPKNIYYEDDCNVSGSFDYSSKYYAIDGAERCK